MLFPVTNKGIVSLRKGVKHRFTWNFQLDAHHLLDFIADFVQECIKMNIFKLKQTVVAIGLAVSLLFGSGLVASQLDLETVPVTHACGIGAHSGGGCAG